LLGADAEPAGADAGAVCSAGQIFDSKTEQHHNLLARHRQRGQRTAPTSPLPLEQRRPSSPEWPCCRHLRQYQTPPRPDAHLHKPVMWRVDWRRSLQEKSERELLCNAFKQHLVRLHREQLLIRLNCTPRETPVNVLCVASKLPSSPTDTRIVPTSASVNDSASLPSLTVNSAAA
jgi:hypothetical protein